MLKLGSEFSPCITTFPEFCRRTPILDGRKLFPTEVFRESKIRFLSTSNIIFVLYLHIFVLLYVWGKAFKQFRKLHSLLVNGAEKSLQPPYTCFNFEVPLQLKFLISVNYHYLFWCYICGAKWIFSVSRLRSLFLFIVTNVVLSIPDLEILITSC